MINSKEDFLKLSNSEENQRTFNSETMTYYSNIVGVRNSWGCFRN